jgi:aryl-phospho-beta-D-glucosidase BglC (GH1 family)
VRFQITRNWSKVDDNQDLDEYRRWIDWRVDNLVQVLDWASQYGLKVCIDLHQPPGGKRGRGGHPFEMNMFHDARYADEFVATWRRIASRVKGHPAIYGYDLINEPAQHGAARFSYWELQRRAAEAVREIDPDTPIIVESNLADRARTFSYLSPLAMDNVIYQAHMYEPTLFTHQGIYDNVTADNGKPLSWPGEWRGEKWDKEFIRRELQPVIDFQRRHKCRIYIGEFSAAAWAPGAENYLRDCISLFEEYGWDWTYHAFREAPVWDVDKEGPDGDHMVPAKEETPRKRALIDGFRGGM